MGTRWFTCKTKAVAHSGLCFVIMDHYTNHRDSDRKGKWHCCTMVTQTCCRPGLQYPPLQSEARARHLKGPHLFTSFQVSVSPILGRRLWGVVHSKATTHLEEIRILLHVSRERQKLRNTCVDIQHCMFLRLTLGMATMIKKKMSESSKPGRRWGKPQFCSGAGCCLVLGNLMISVITSLNTNVQFLKQLLQAHKK